MPLDEDNELTTMPHNSHRRGASNVDLVAVVGAVFAILTSLSTFVQVIQLENETRNLILGIGVDSNVKPGPQFKTMLLADWFSFFLGSSLSAFVLGAIFLAIAFAKNVFGAELHRASRFALGITGALFLVAGLANFVLGLIFDLPNIW